MGFGSLGYPMNECLRLGSEFVVGVLLLAMMAILNLTLQYSERR